MKNDYLLQALSQYVSAKNIRNNGMRIIANACASRMINHFHKQFQYCGAVLA